MSVLSRKKFENYEIFKMAARWNVPTLTNYAKQWTAECLRKRSQNTTKNDYPRRHYGKTEWNLIINVIEKNKRK